MPKILGREPALILGFIAAMVKLAGAFWLHLTIDQQATINALAAAIVGLIIAWIVHQGAPAAILGLAQAGLALAVGFGAHLSADLQALIMSTIAMAVSLVVRSLVTAPVPAAAIPAGSADVTGG